MTTIQGEIDYPNGERYVGRFVNDRPEGAGVKTWPDGRRYDGQFVRGLPNGQVEPHGA